MGVVKLEQKGYDTKDFLKEIKAYNPQADTRLIEKAFNYVKKVHGSQRRDSGEPFYTHPIEVSRILMRLNVDSSTICAALLHDVLEDTKITKPKLERQFNKEIARMVEGLTNLDKVTFRNREEYTSANIRKVLLASAKDIRVILIKLADRLHNMRTLKHVSSERQQRIAQETLDIYAPIAEKLGIWFIKGELEDLSLRFLDPKMYTFLKERVGEKREERERKTKRIVEYIDQQLKKNGISSRVFGRAKYFYSIYKKMQRKDKDFDQIFDLIGIRIVTSTEEECYAALNLVHMLWPHKKTAFKDYIKYPKDNGYQSLHTTVYGPYNKMLEIQIRSLHMHYESEDGVAAHWRYKGTARDKEFERRIQWFKQAIEWIRHSDDSKDFIESLKVDLFDNEIVVLTPKGDPITIKEGATVLDFAYEVHTSIGNHCAGAKVNGKGVPLNHKLTPGVVVEIRTSEKISPSRSWLQMVETNRARSKIKHALGLTEGGKVVKHSDVKSRITKDIDVKTSGVSGSIKLASCCKPTVNDPIIAFVGKRSSIMVHKLDCPNISIFSKQKRVDVSWKVQPTEQQSMILKFKVHDRVGLFAEILNLLSEFKISLESIKSKVSHKHIHITIATSAVSQDVLLALRRRVKAIPDVIHFSSEISEKV